jgi:hypothetical protein
MELRLVSWKNRQELGPTVSPPPLPSIAVAVENHGMAVIGS